MVLKKSELGATDVTTTNKSERSQTDSEAPMGRAATRSLERVAAAMGELQSAPIEFQAACDVTKGGVLLALPALLAAGLLRHSANLYALPAGFYGIMRFQLLRHESIFLLLALLALARVKSNALSTLAPMEQVRHQFPGEWGKL